ncbi:interferon-inducible GTPase-domain-containing protein [Suillus clintonianus]|uniref:interferon-inducible GTPase-domain-containing protein n=1 Tax=Suillus clintonianus TaxID=1904413 RepID=UPI001B865403|nr:interferon-inducible GTPase-domain-containing protein [Suillus clintonianus]KAG2125777.1 interferon-inducible GTPase-domain-containing protein [Suillus clintonianus]
MFFVPFMVAAMVVVSGRYQQQKAEEANRVTCAAKYEAERARCAAEEAAENKRARRAAEENVERVRRAAETEADNAGRRRERAAAGAADALRIAAEARLVTKRQLLEGVRPEYHPSEEDIVHMKTKYFYSPSFLHIAVVGSSGVGKSSFINAVRGLSNNHPIAARAGIVDCTPQVTRYPDPRPDSRIIWYDVPGAGTPNVPDWQYFNALGLYIFDCIIVLIDNRVLESDLAIIRACEQFTNVEVFIVRSKSDQHINNMACDRMSGGFDPCDPDVDDETRCQFLQIKSEERTRFIDETRQNVRMHVENKNLAPQKVYIVCKDAMLAIWNNSRSSKAIDEAELLEDVKERVDAESARLLPNIRLKCPFRETRQQGNGNMELSIQSDASQRRPEKERWGCLGRVLQGGRDDSWGTDQTRVRMLCSGELGDA